MKACFAIGALLVLSACGAAELAEPTDADFTAALRGRHPPLAILGSRIIDCTRAKVGERQVRVCQAWVAVQQLPTNVMGEPLGSKSGGVCWRATLARSASVDQPEVVPEQGGVWAVLGEWKYNGNLIDDRPEDLVYPRSPELSVSTPQVGFGFGPPGLAVFQNGRRLTIPEALRAFEAASDKEPQRLRILEDVRNDRAGMQRVCTERLSS